MYVRDFTWGGWGEVQPCKGGPTFTGDGINDPNPIGIYDPKYVFRPSWVASCVRTSRAMGIVYPNPFGINEPMPHEGVDALVVVGIPQC